MIRYYFNFRKGDELSLDRVGMYLPNVDAARNEALYAWRELLMIATATGEERDNSEIQIVDQNGDKVLTIPLGQHKRFH